MTPSRLEAYQLLHQGTLAFARAEQAGMRIDVDYCRRKMAHLTRKIEKIEGDFRHTKFYQHWHYVYEDKTNIGSDYQLAHILYGIKKIQPTKTTPKGRGSVDEEALLQLNLPEVVPLGQVKKLRKLRDVYLDAFVREQVDGVVHPFFNLNTVRTYRSSSDSPNFQNIPKRDKEAMEICRRAIFPRPGHLLGEVDYGGIEVRVSCCYNRDPKLIYDTIHGDMHGDEAKEIFKVPDFDRTIPDHRILRDATKNGFVFPQFYGSYYVNCTHNLAVEWGKLPKTKWKPGQGIPFVGRHLSDHLIEQGIQSYEEFEEHVRKVEDRFWNERFQVYQRWKNDWWKAYQRLGYFDLLTGFRCSGVMSQKEACNYPIQGSAFHCLLWSFNRVDEIQRAEKWDSRLVGQVHDSMILDIHPAELEHVMFTIFRVTCEELPKAWPWIVVPLEVEAEVAEVDEPWSAKKKYALAA